MYGSISTAHGAIGILFIGLGLGVFFFARHKAAEQEEPEVDAAPARPEVARAEWFPNGVWGVERGIVQPAGDNRQMVYDWDRNRDVPPVYVGGGRGHAL